MIAYDDRPDRRIKDIQDINSICQNYPLIELDHIWSKHFDLYDTRSDHFDVGMIVLGREMDAMISGNTGLKERILGIVDGAIASKSDFLLHMIKDARRETIEMKRNLLLCIRQGLTNK